MNPKYIDHIPDGSVVFFSAVFGYKHLFYKPFHYIIQVVTRSKYHHVGIVSNNLFYEASSKTGVRCIKFKDKCSELSEYEDFDILIPGKKLSTEKAVVVDRYLNDQVGKKYATFQAFLSILTGLLLFNRDRIKTKKMFCSKFILGGKKKLYPAKLKDVLPRDNNPEELRRILIELGYKSYG